MTRATMTKDPTRRITSSTTTTHLLVTWLFLITYSNFICWMSLSQEYDDSSCSSSATTTINKDNDNDKKKKLQHPSHCNDVEPLHTMETHEDMFLNKTPLLRTRGGHCPPAAGASGFGDDDDDDFVYDAAAAAMSGIPGTTTTTSSSSISSTIPLMDPPRPVIVNIPKYGRVQGKRDGGIDFFGGIPYASPPVGGLRFAPPEPPISWAPAKLDATHFGPDCWQIADPIINPNVDPHQMSEDCLYLNIFTPAGHAAAAAAAAVARPRNPILSVGWGASTSSSGSGSGSRSNNNNNHGNPSSSSTSSSSSSKLLPVMVWFHGGAFQMGGARRPEYDGRRLAERNMVVVTFNYRLGALGFLVSSPDGLYGNFGLMDQRAVLHWIHDNIRAFGGDPNNVTLFGESAGAVMIGLHLMMMKTSTTRSGSSSTSSSSTNKLFHKAILQSNPLGYTFRSVVVDDFIGEALKRSMDCRDLACLRSERVEEIMRAQSNLMGVPRSVGDFFTWGPTLTQDVKVAWGARQKKSEVRTEHQLFRNIDLYTTSSGSSSGGDSFGSGGGSSNSGWAAVNVSQPLKNMHLIPDEIPILIGSNKHEGEIFIHSAFPITMSKPVYWMFVGALFRDSASRVLKHYRGYVAQIEQEAAKLANKQLEEEENKMYYLEHREQLEHEYEMLLAMNATRRANYKNLASKQVLETLVKTWSTGGASQTQDESRSNTSTSANTNARRWWPFGAGVPQDEQLTELQRIAKEHREAEKIKQREEKRRQRVREKALKEAAKVVVDYRPVMSRIIDDYLFRCPSWHYAHIVSRNRVRRGNMNNVFVYRFSQPTHIPGFKECWGKSCHTAELPYVFQAMDAIRSNYSTLGPYAQKEAPSAPEYPYTDLLEAYRGALEAVDQEFDVEDPDAVLDLSGRKEASESRFKNMSHTKAFQRLLISFFGDYFAEDADEEIATDMAERWSSFARTGDPNYDGSKVEWLPWRFIPSEDDEDAEWNVRFGNNGQATSSQEDFWNDIEFLSDDEDDESENTTASQEGFQWSDVKEERAYRRRALRALGMEVVEEDSLRTELRRAPRSQEGDLDRAFLISKFLFRTTLGGKEESHSRIPKRVIRQVQRIAQDMGVLGTGLQGEDPRFADWDDDFFPELLELKWPPEGRLVERDCTCDMWDRIRYRY